jgi:hypothetical protein
MLWYYKVGLYAQTGLQAYQSIVAQADRELCRGGSSICRGQVTADFFAMPEDWQRWHYVHLAPSIKRQYHARLRALFETVMCS